MAVLLLLFSTPDPTFSQGGILRPIFGAYWLGIPVLGAANQKRSL